MFLKRFFIVTGSVSEPTITRILKCLFNFDYDPNKRLYISFNLAVYVNCDLNKITFDFVEFRKKCFQYKNLCGIICIEDLNPRPQTLNGDLNELTKLFSENEFKKNSI